MFGITFFSNKVSSRLFKKGYEPHQLPPHKVFKPLCDALEQNGYTPDQAAELWDSCFKDDPEAIKKMHKDTGIVGMTILGRL